MTRDAAETLESIAAELAPLVCFSDDPETVKGVEFQIQAALSRVVEIAAQRSEETALRWLMPAAARKLSEAIRRAFQPEASEALPEPVQEKR